MNSAAIAHAQARLGDIAAHRRQAIALLTQAQRTWTREAHPVDWAMTRFNLGLAYGDRSDLGGGRPDLELAIASVRAAASVFTEADFPFHYRNHIVPVLEALRTAWLQGGHGTQAEFDAIPPAG